MLTRLDELNPNAAASVYFQLPGAEFQLLGALTQDKPSAIFKINHSKSNYIAPSSADLDAMDEDDVTSPFYGGYKINVGISLEPLADVQNQLQQLREQHQQLVPARTSASSLPPDSIALLANKIVQNAYNFLAGFTGNDGKVPMRVFDDWWTKFKSRLSSDPRFLESLCNN